MANKNFAVKNGLDVGGTATATTFSGSGSLLTSLPAAELTGTVASARISGSYTGITGVGTVTVGTWSGSFGAVSGANLTSLTAANLSGTIPSGVLGNSSVYIGTTAVALNRGTGALTLAGLTLTTPNIGVASGTSLDLSGELNSTTLTVDSSASVYGVLNVGPTASGPRLVLDNDSTTTAEHIQFVYNGAKRWEIGPNSSNDFSFNLYTSGEVLDCNAFWFDDSTGYTTVTRKLTTTGGRRFNTVTKTGSYTATADDHIIRCSGSGFTLTLPTGPGDGTTISVINSHASVTGTIAAGGGDTVSNGSTGPAASRNLAYRSGVTLVYIGTNWYDI